MTVAMFTERSWSMAAFIGSASQFVTFATPSPRLMLTEAMLNDARRSYTRLRPARMSLSRALSYGPKTLIAMIWAPWAMPEDVFVRGAGGGGTALGALPAAMPATWVP